MSHTSSALPSSLVAKRSYNGPWCGLFYCSFGTRPENSFQEVHSPHGLKILAEVDGCRKLRRLWKGASSLHFLLLPSSASFGQPNLSGRGFVRLRHVCSALMIQRKGTFNHELVSATLPFHPSWYFAVIALDNSTISILHLLFQASARVGTQIVQL